MLCPAQARQVGFQKKLNQSRFGACGVVTTYSSPSSLKRP
jgi:hypothetical protein